MPLADIICQQRALDTLQHALLSDRLHHAYIFTGPNGVGKETTAKQWAKMLLCSSRVKINANGRDYLDSCGTCSSCELFESGAHPDYSLIYKELRQYTKDGKGKAPPVEMPIDVIREFLVEKVADRPGHSNCRVFVVTECEKLNSASQNAMLKVLEEPAKHCFIILITSKLDSLLPTTRSRCQVVRFGPVKEDQVIKKLQAGGTDGKEAAFFARFSGGSLGQAIQLAGLKELETKPLDFYRMKTEIVSMFAALKLADAVDKANWLCSQSKALADALTAQGDVSVKDIGRTSQKIIYSLILSVANDAMKLGTGIENEIINADQAPQVAAVLEKFGIDGCSELITLIYENIRWVDSNVNEKLNFEHLLLKSAGCGIILNS